MNDHEVNHAQRTHALLSASSAHRWMACPPSVRLTEQFEDQPSVFAEEGTFLHELSEIKLHIYLGDVTPDVLERQYAEHKDSEFYTEEAEEVTDVYVNHCIEVIEAVRSSCPDAYIAVEQKLDYSEYVPDGFGTGDLLIIGDGIIEVIDFKGGRGVRVDAGHNSQLMLYGLGALLGFDALYDIKTVRMTIVQPRLNNISTFEMEADDLIKWAETEARPKALLAYEGKGDFCAGEHCRFCKARYTCRARAEYHMQLADRDFKQPNLLTDAEVAEILPVAESLNNWVEDLIAYATQQAVHGKQWPGYKLVEGRTRRKYLDEAEVIRACTEAGITDIYKTSLLGVSDLEKRIGRKQFAEIVGKYVIKPDGEPTLVPDTDTRAPYASAADEFKN